MMRHVARIVGFAHRFSNAVDGLPDRVRHLRRVRGRIDHYAALRLGAGDSEEPLPHAFVKGEPLRSNRSRRFLFL